MVVFELSITNLLEELNSKFKFKNSFVTPNWDGFFILKEYVIGSEIFNVAEDVVNCGSKGVHPLIKKSTIIKVNRTNNRLSPIIFNIYKQVYKYFYGAQRIIKYNIGIIVIFISSYEDLETCVRRVEKENVPSNE